jgi:chromosomal replication initiation ATPase DnaA
MIQIILDTICDREGFSKSELMSKCKKRELVEARYYCWYGINAVRGYAGISTTQAGKIFNRDHATFIYGVKHIETMGDVHKDVKERLIRIKKYVRAMFMHRPEKTSEFEDLENLIELQ